LEKVASQRKALERELKTMGTANGNQQGIGVPKADVGSLLRFREALLESYGCGAKARASIPVGV
jgi:hypothetical protein